ncbi:MAG TPA: DUF6298 domain-containing protein [Verrucomicrobiae bacterium]|nr:DUF6298 domain-containing protein [Verrucomicrobiae bacterium]
MKNNCIALLAFWFAAASVCAAPLPPIISMGTNGLLRYHDDSEGDRIPDFSSCGYRGGEAAIPAATVVIFVDARGGDSTERIQRALNHVATLPPNSDGLRGAVLLSRGRHEVFGSLVISNSGVVLRGSGIGSDGTQLVAAGNDRRTLVRAAGRGDIVLKSNASWRVVNPYVPVGATTIELAGSSGLKAGDSVRVIRQGTEAWIHELGAREFGGGVGGGWRPGTRDIAWDRVIQSVQANTISLDAPITTAISNGNATILAVETWAGRVERIGIENLALESSWNRGNAKDEDHSWCAITMDNVRDAWVRQVTFKHFAGSAVAVHETASRVTVQDCVSTEPVSEDGGYRRNTFFTMGQQTLFLRCYAEDGRHDFSAGHCAAGPNAFVQCDAKLPSQDSGPIQSWASGVLYDNVNIDGNAITLGFRPGNNAGIGWAAANCVLWNCSASVIRVWNPPGAQNWSFGSWAGFEGDGIWRSSNDFMEPGSLFAAQVRERWGGAAMDRLQLMPRPREESSNPPLNRAQELAAAAHQPPPHLKDYILDASHRDPLPAEATNARRLEDIENNSPETGDATHKSSIINHKLTLTNGWLTLNGRLLIGGIQNVTWWRGSIRPSEAAQFGVNVTRFVPGRPGAGLTDDLQEVSDVMHAGGRVALDHNYGLWYDRRRDDHERVRRMSGDVLPPFYEQPFARSGQGIGWDGLSRYDLTKFNPWYWKRLREFASLGEQRGQVLFHQNYFQHNILEAGAHWADFPWRSANNINDTGFPEPPPYAGDKRIFQAELFYDVSHPVRRELHRGYIRQCLENFTNCANVIHFTSAEFTGPLHFMQFWLDTIGEWTRDAARASKPAAPLIALSATKDVQDSILSDPKRREIVDVIDFRYWWRTENGEFAPPGGKNLAPRQFERQSRAGRPNETSLAGMAAEYRAKFPAKPVICNFDIAAWAWLCAGGSLPRLPRDTAPELLDAIPSMAPAPDLSRPGVFVLREEGRRLLVYAMNHDVLNLENVGGKYRMHSIDPRTGVVTRGDVVTIDDPIRVSTPLTWLVKEEQ